MTKLIAAFRNLANAPKNNDTPPIEQIRVLCVDLKENSHYSRTQH
jgi:hypothetical protein